jgi:peptide/nickel transport system permease protein
MIQIAVGERALKKKATRSKAEAYYLASEWQLIWWKFTRHKLAMIATPVLIVLYLCAIFPEFIAPYGPTTRFPDNLSAAPVQIHFIDSDHHLRWPFVYKRSQTLNLKTFRREYTEDTSKAYPIRLFTEGESYKLWGLFPGSLHLFGAGDVPLFIFGSDALGLDLCSRIIYGARISLTIGLVGVFLSFFLGTIIGGISGYYGGLTDNIIQRTIDFLISIPTLPLWMALSAAVPRDWPVTQTYFAITIVLSIIGWCGLARVVRGKLLALREEDFALAARASGAGEWRIITKHLLPSFLSYLIVSITLSIPNMIIGETTLSFLGLGMRPPAVSWGVLLQDAQQLVIVAQQPWLLIPCLFVFVTVLMFNFLGDGLRDAADPYTR